MIVLKRPAWVSYSLLALALSGACTAAPATVPTAAPGKPAESAASTGGGKPFAGRTIRVATWGGDWGNGVKTSAGKLFEEQTGAKVEYSLGNPVDNLTKLLATRGEPPFDVMQMDNYTEAIMIEKGLLETVDHSKLNVNDLFPEAANVTKEYGPAFTLVPAVVAWVPSKYKDLGLSAPKTFDDLFDPKLKGRVAYPGMRVGFAPLIITGLGYGWFGDQGAVAQAAQKLKQMDPRIYGASPEMATWLTNGEVYTAVTHTAQVVAMLNQGFALDYVYPQVKDKNSMVYWNVTDVVKGTKNRDMAEKWLAINLSAQAQELFGQSNGVLPTDKSIAAKFAQDPKLKSLAITPAEMSKMFQVDAKFVNDNRDKWNDDWNRIMGT